MRDPRIDPKPGDVLRKPNPFATRATGPWSTMEVVSRKMPTPGQIPGAVRVRTASGRSSAYDMPAERFREWAKDAEVLKVAE